LSQYTATANPCQVARCERGNPHAVGPGATTPGDNRLGSFPRPRLGGQIRGGGAPSAARFLARLWDFGNAPPYHRFQLVTPGVRWPSWGIAGGDFRGLVETLEEIAEAGPQAVYWCPAAFLPVRARKVRGFGAENAATLGPIVLDLDTTPLADALRRLEAIGIEPHTIVQTSPGRHQLALMVRQTRLGRGNRAAELDRRRRLVRRLASIVGADPHAATALHRFRLPGLPRRLADGSTFTPFIVSTSSHAPHATSQLFQRLPAIKPPAPRACYRSRLARTDAVPGGVRAIDAEEKAKARASQGRRQDLGTSSSGDDEVSNKSEVRGKSNERIAEALGIGSPTVARVRAIDAGGKGGQATPADMRTSSTFTSADVRVSASDRRSRGSAGRVAKALGIGSPTVARVRAIDAGEKGRQATRADMRTSGTSTSEDAKVGGRDKSATRVAKTLGIGEATVGRVLSTGALRRLRFGCVGDGHRNAAVVALAYACARDGLTESQALTLISEAVVRWENGEQYNPAALRASVRSCYSHPRGLVAERLLAICDSDGQPIITPHEARLACLVMRHPRPLRPASELHNLPAVVRSVDVLRVLAELQRATRDHQGRRRRRGAPVLIDARSLAELSGVPLGSVQGAIIPAFRRAGVYRVTRRGRSSVGSFAIEALDHTQATPQAGAKAYSARFIEWTDGRGAAAVAAPWFAARFAALIAPIVGVLVVAAALRSAGLLSESAGPQAVPVEGARNRPTSRGPPASGRAARVGTTKDGADGRGVCPGRDARYPKGG